jgi:dihydrofolate reductase
MEVILLMAATVDGKIARNSTHPTDWTGNVDKRYFRKITKEAGVVVMGSKTYDTIGKPLPGRFNFVMTRNKSRQSDQDNLIFTDQHPIKVLEAIESMGYTSVALIGGASINTLFIWDNLITQIHLVVVPRLFGAGMSLFDGALHTRLSLNFVKDLGDDHFLLVYDVKT